MCAHSHTQKHMHIHSCIIHTCMYIAPHRHTYMHTAAHRHTCGHIWILRFLPSYVSLVICSLRGAHSQPSWLLLVGFSQISDAVTNQAPWLQTLQKGLSSYACSSHVTKGKALCYRLRTWVGQFPQLGVQKKNHTMYQEFPQSQGTSTLRLKGING